ncbi:hypothetical protein SAMN05216339_103155 [Nitrosomonas eutropha]|uniref:Asparagine synthase n=1 Tax=Nitrosomonas eutropha TaxID=916 RepID=A0A1I7GSZ8_9PROT|nr:hypothetical protein [Nitrosomonas eutropha]SFU51567.1 hypothetical protein SAMN05216339_103155 [Nitrosomonas eutropha]
MNFLYHMVPNWPPLAWIALCSEKNSAVTVWHGNRVETHDHWFCEAVWPGAFEEGNFDQTDLVAGTGGRCRDGSIVFVAPGNTTDRILSLLTDKGLFVSNSLACLLAVSGAEINLTYPDYYKDFTSIIYGLSRYKRTILTSLGDIQIMMFGYIVWDSNKVAYIPRTLTRRNFSSFARYEQFLQENLNKLADNIAARSRKHGYQFLATASSGYDSPAIAALAYKAGCKDALCIDKDRFGEAENGDQVAAYLGLNPVCIARDAWRELDRVETFFLAADGTAEAVSLASAEAELSGRVLLTGYHGDKIWAKDTKDLGEDVVRGDSSGLSLTEYRLWAGFIHCPITFWGVQQIRDINHLSNAEEMRSWDVVGNYSRPVPRRIIESAGVPREAFGITKKASAIGFSEFLSPASMEIYRTWLAKNRMEWLKRGRIPPPLSKDYERITQNISGAMESILHKTPLLWRFAPENSLDRPSQLRQYAFAWAINEVSARYDLHFDNS